MYVFQVALTAAQRIAARAAKFGGAGVGAVAAPDTRKRNLSQQQAGAGEGSAGTGGTTSPSKVSAERTYQFDIIWHLTVGRLCVVGS
jgi:hypothetical protein